MSTLHNLQDELDLLVDDELPEERRRELLAQLDQWPDGWRRCALSFLESRCIGESLSVAGVSRRRRSVPWTALAACAAVLMAFGSGYLLRSASPTAPPAAVEVAAALPSSFGESLSVFEVGELDGLPSYSTYKEIPPFVVDAILDAGHRVQRVERMVLLEAGDGGETRLPLRETRILQTTPVSL